ncbi:MAG: MoxR family ATPase [Peptococcaceae bacterium]|nr:MoxR family ATPase [Peptococcaceae bacterium]
MSDCFECIDKVQDCLLKNGYLVDRKTATTIFLAVRMKKPLLVEGPAGVGKTELARALARTAGAELIRLQCYPGLDESKALYEWNYQKQILYLQAAREISGWEEIKAGVYTPEFLLARPVLKAFLSPGPVVLLVDEVDKSDDELESFLLEALSEYQVSIPELGTVKARTVPMVVITSNNTREFSDALKRRCLHLYIPFPDQKREEAILLLHLKDINRALAGQVSHFLARVRKMALRKLPGISETIDWARSLAALNVTRLDPEAVRLTLNALIKYEEDVAAVEAKLEDLIPPSQNRETDERPGSRAASPPGGSPAGNDILSRFNF